MCKNPYMKGGTIPFGCGQCLPCRINRRRLWTHRLVLESLLHAGSSFVTLTYSDEMLPEGGSLDPRDLQLFMKRLRKDIEPKKIRFYGVGEYGDQTFRPHYHLALFGLGSEDHQVIANAWRKDDKPIGHVHIGELNKDTAQYVAGYVTKKMTASDDPRLCGRHPEFARMSNRPGIGADAMKIVGAELMTKHGSLLVAELGDVPSSLKHGGRSLPLGRYLVQKLRDQLGIPNLGVHSPRYKEYVSELLQVYEEAKEANKHTTRRGALGQKYNPKIRSIETREKIFKQRRSI